MNWKYVKKALLFGLVVGLCYTFLVAAFTIALPTLGSTLWNIGAFTTAYVIVDFINGRPLNL